MRTRSQRLLSMVLALSMLLTFLPVSAFAEGTPPPYAASNADPQPLDPDDNTYTADGNTYTYELNTADHTATLTKFTGTTADVPETVMKGTETYKVTTIGEKAFANDTLHNNTTLNSVKLPDTIRIIGDHAFSSCKAITSIIIPKDVVSIGIGAFTECTELSEVTLRDCNSLKSIGDAAFSYCSALTSIVLPEGLTTVGGGSFCATGLTNITVPKSLKKVGQTAFWSIFNDGTHKGIQTVTYTGTLDQWEALTKSNDFADYNKQLLEAPHFIFAAYSTTPAPNKPNTEQPGTQKPGTTTPTTPPESTGKPTDKPTDKPNEPTTPEQPGTPEKPNEPTPPEVPAVEEDDTAALGYAAAAVTAAFVGWGVYRIGSEVYLKYLLPKDVLLPQNRIQLAELLWEDAGRPAPADAAPYADVDADDTDARQAARWAVEKGLLTLPDTEKPEEFAPYRSVSYAKSARAWNKAQQLKENAAR